MTENKRFKIVKTDTYDLYVPVDEMKVYIFPSFEEELDCIRIVNALNELEERKENGRIASKYLEENEQLKSEIINVIDRKIKNNDKNPPQDFQVYSKVNRALKDVRESLRDVIEDF